MVIFGMRRGINPICYVTKLFNWYNIWFAI